MGVGAAELVEIVAGGGRPVVEIVLRFTWRRSVRRFGRTGLRATAHDLDRAAAAAPATTAPPAPAALPRPFGWRSGRGGLPAFHRRRRVSRRRRLAFAERLGRPLV